MASSSKKQENKEPTSYTSMSIGDIDQIGSHCADPFCRQLDFLPFRCESCRGTYCLDHRTETAHKCTQAGAWARRKREADSPYGYVPTVKPNVLNHEKQCAAPVCKTLIDTALTTGVHCTTCNRRYCLKHRMREDHDCANLKPLGARPPNVVQAQKEKGLAALEKLRAWGASKKAATASVSAASKKVLPTRSSTSRVAALNQLKASAKGEASIPQDKRIYLHVEASADTTTAKYPTGNFFYNQEWSVGRMLDVAAKALQVQNLNNHNNKEEDKLRVFHVEGGRLLDFSEKLNQSLKSGNTVVLLRGVGPPVPDLIEA